MSKSKDYQLDQPEPRDPRDGERAWKAYMKAKVAYRLSEKERRRHKKIEEEEKAREQAEEKAGMYTKKYIRGIKSNLKDKGII